MNIGDSVEGLRDMCFFLCKETSKSYVHLQTVLNEYYNLVTLKEYLYAEMIIQHMQTALLKKDLIVAKGLKEDKTTTEQLTYELKSYKRELGFFQSENRDLKLNIISLNETIEDLSSKKKRLEEQNDAKSTRLLKLETHVAELEAEKSGRLSKHELSVLEDNLRSIFTSLVV